jgi:ORF6N domain
VVTAELVPIEHVERTILFVRGHKVLLDVDLAELYGVSAKALNQAVKRNRARFPPDFMFRLTPEEARRSRSQIVTLNVEAPDLAAKNPRDRAAVRGHNIKYLPYAFTEHGVAMLSSVLRSPRAIQVNIEIMRAFAKLRQLLQSNAHLAKKLAALETKYDVQFKVVFDAIRELMAPPVRHRRQIGFRDP